MFKDFQKYCTQLNLKPTDKLLLGVSGGIDSIVLLELFARLKQPIHVLHYNFHLRGPESNRDQDFVTKRCQALNIPCHVEQTDTYQYAKEHNLSIQMAARELRYSAFRTYKEKFQCQYIALAHHNDDSIETFFINAIRGSGLRGLCGIPTNANDIIRPLAPFSRADIAAWAKKENICYVEDSSNAADKYLRNYIRHHLIPGLEHYVAGTSKGLSRTMRYVNDALQIQNHYIQTIREQATLPSTNGIRLNLDVIRQTIAPNLVLFELIHPYGFNEDTIIEVLRSDARSSGRDFFSQTHHMLISRNIVEIVPIDEHSTQSYSISYQTIIDNPTFQINDNNAPLSLHFSFYNYNQTTPISFQKTSLYLNADKLQFPLLLRHWKDGDTFQPFGMRGTKKLSDYFRDAKLSNIEKQNIWLLCNADDSIIAIIGMRSDERYRIQHGDKVLQIDYMLSVQ